MRSLPPAPSLTDESQEPNAERRRHLALAGLRLALLVILHGVVIAFHLRGDLQHFQTTSRMLVFIVGAGFFATMVDLARLRRGTPSRVGDALQLIVDQGLWTGLVYLSGGPTSPATSLYALTCLAGAISLGRFGAAVAFAGALAFYVPLAGLLALGVLGPPADQAHFAAVTMAGSAYAMSSAILGTGAVAILAASLAERLQISANSLKWERLRAIRAEEMAIVGRLAAGLAHEIRNPIGSIRGCAEILGERASLTDADRNLLRVVVRESSRLDDLVSDMLHLAKPRTPTCQRIDLGILVKDVVSMAQGSSDGRELICEADPHCMVFVDPDQFRQVLWNLVRNAFQATPAGKRVWVRISLRGAVVEVVVEDEGRGLPPGPNAVFDPAFSARTGGTGIGLAVVKRVVDAHAAQRARIAADEREGGGARFVLTIDHVGSEALS